MKGVFLRLCELKAFKTLDSKGLSDLKSPETQYTFSDVHLWNAREEKDKKAAAAAAWEICMDSVIQGVEGCGKEIWYMVILRQGPADFSFWNSRFFMYIF